MHLVVAASSNGRTCLKTRGVLTFLINNNVHASVRDEERAREGEGERRSTREKPGVLLCFIDLPAGDERDVLRIEPLLTHSPLLLYAIRARAAIINRIMAWKYCTGIFPSGRRGRRPRDSSRTPNALIYVCVYLSIYVYIMLALTRRARYHRARMSNGITSRGDILLCWRGFTVLRSSGHLFYAFAARLKG